MDLSRPESNSPLQASSGPNLSLRWIPGLPVPVRRVAVPSLNKARTRSRAGRLLLGAALPLLTAASYEAQTISITGGSGDERTGVPLTVTLNRDARSGEVRVRYKADNGPSAQRSAIPSVYPPGTDLCTVPSTGGYGDFEYQSGELVFPAGSETVEKTATVRVCPGRCIRPQGYELEFVILGVQGATAPNRTALGTILPLPGAPWPCTHGDPGTPGDGDGDGNGDADGDGDGDGDGDDDDDDDDGDDGDDREPELRIDDARASEDEGSLAFTVELDAQSNAPVTVDWATSAGTATPGQDYTEASGTLTIAAGATSGAIQVAVTDDDLDEDDETLTVTLSAPANATPAAGGATASGVIVDNDGLPKAQIADASAMEDEGELEFVVRLEGRSAKPVTVDWATSAGTATPGQDYTEASGTLTIAPGEAAGAVQVAVTDDEVHENDETLTVTLSTPANATLAEGGATASGVVVDNDAAPRILIADAEALEGEGRLSFAVTLTTETVEQVTVDWATSAGTATPGQDYTEASETLTFMPGQTARTIHVPVRDDKVQEEDETLSVALSEPTNATLVDEMGTATGVILDNDALPRIRIANAYVDEDDRELEFAVTLQGRSALSVAVEWTTVPGTAKPNADYVPASGTLILGPTATRGTILVELIDDNVKEENETLTLTLSRPVNARINGRTISATGTIGDNDEAPAPPPEIRITDSGADESAGRLVFTATLGRAVNQPATVRWATSDGSATAGTDYVAGIGTLTFAPGATSAEIAIGLLEDLVREETEIFHITLSDPANATLGASKASGLIQDDDGPELVEAWLARFSRTAASHALEAVEDRIGRWRHQGSHMTIAGRRIDLPRSESWTAAGASWRDPASWTGPATSAGLLPGPLGAPSAAVTSGGIPGVFGGSASTGLLQPPTGFGTRQPHGGGHRSLHGGPAIGQVSHSGLFGMELGDLLPRSSFQFSGATGRDRIGLGLVAPADEGSEAGAEGSIGYGWSIWGRGATTRFGGGEDNISVGGDVATGTVGIDFERGRVIVGVAASHTFGQGDVLEYGNGRRVKRDTDMKSYLTTGLPYLRVALSDSLSIWGILGHGRGSMTMTQGDLGSIETDIAMSMGAVGLRQDLKESASECRCLDLALKTDFLVLNATADESVALPELSRDVSRARLMMEGSRTTKLDSGAVLIPSAEVGLRYDGGDAETGGGMEFGAGIRYANAPRGLLMELKGRSLLTHQSGELTEWGLAGAIRVDPGASDRGLSFGLRSSWGNASSGVTRLWEQPQQGAAALGYRGAEMRTLAEADLGYRLNLFGDRVRLMPYLGAGLSEQSGQAYRLGARLRLWESLDLDLEGAQRDSPGLLPSGYVLGVRGSYRW